MASFTLSPTERLKNRLCQVQVQKSQNDETTNKIK